MGRSLGGAVLRRVSTSKLRRLCRIWRLTAVWCFSLGAGCAGSVEPGTSEEPSADGGLGEVSGSPGISNPEVPGDVPGSNPTAPNGAPPDATEAAPEPSGVFADGSPAPSEVPGVEPETCEAAAREAPLLKLGTVEYRNTVRDLLTILGAGEVTQSIEPGLAAIPDDSRNQLFSGLDTRVALEHIEGYFNVAKQIASSIVGDDELLRAVASDCALETTLSEECLTDFVERFGLLAYRHPLTDDERSDLFEQGSAETTPRNQVRAVIIAAMISPRFVNHVEVDGAWLGTDSDTLQLSAYEIVSRLSYAYWQTMPDDELFAAAADGSVLTTEGLAQTVERVLADPRAKRTLWSFWKEWLALDNFTGFEFGRPGFQALTAGMNIDEDLYADMVDEVRVLTEEFTFSQPATFKDLLETGVSVTSSQQLADLYGVAPWSGTGDFPTLNGQERAGLFQRAALLVSSLEQTNPFHRGAFVKRNLLCESLPAPDPAALPPGSLDIPPTSEAETTRQRFEGKVENNDLCSGCHGLFSSVGYALEAYDSLGRYRTTERVFDEASGDLLAELPVDPAAEVVVGGVSSGVSGPVELNRLMLESGNLEQCLAQQYLRFMTRQDPGAAPEDVCLPQEIASVTSNAGLLAGFRRLAELSAFYQRKVGAQ